MIHPGFAIVLLLISWTWAARDPPGFEDGSDLENFVTRPDLRAPRYIVTKHHPEALAPGYWFVAHYPSLFDAPSTWRKEHLPFQTGIHIYDNDGSLVWSGAKDYRNVNAFDFKAFMLNGEHHLSFYVGGVKEDNVAAEKRDHGGVMMNNNYEEVSRTVTDVSQGLRVLDVHEFTILPGAKSALVSINYPDEGDAADIGQEGNRALLAYGFQEVEIGTGNLLFEWEPLRHGVSLNESVDTTNMAPTASESWWDWFHLNSVEKNKAGDYLVSGRHTSCVYKISGLNGHVMWRLGGLKSDFHVGEGVHFEWQHHARWLHENQTTTIISVFDNHADDTGRNHDIPNGVSWGKIIQLDHTTMTATLLRGFERPDGGQSQKLGSVQALGEDHITANVFVNWAQSSYISEYDGQNRLILEAKMSSPRMWTYRAYKLPWVGRPKEPIMLKGLPNIVDEGRAAYTWYVSWNGATEVESWVFHSSDTPGGPYEKVATVAKVGFETSWTTTRIRPHAFVEAIDSKGEVLGKSNVTNLVTSKQWLHAPSTQPRPGKYPESQHEDQSKNYADKQPENQAGESTVKETQTSGKKDRENESWNPIRAIPYLIIDGLAIYALYILGKALIPGLMKKRKGYLRVDPGLDEPILGSAELQESHLPR